MKAEDLARYFHQTYENLAPHYGYETRKASAVPWAQVPENNRRLMIAVCESVLHRLAAKYETLDARGEVLRIHSDLAEIARWHRQNPERSASVVRIEGEARVPLSEAEISLALVQACEGCGAVTASINIYKDGWRTITSHDGEHALTCPECQKGLEGPDRSPNP